MNNKITRTSKNLDIFTNVVGKITIGMGIVCILIAFISLSTFIFDNKIFAEGTITFDIDFLKFYLSDKFIVNERFLKLYAFTGCLGGGIICFLISYISTLFRKILSPMKDGRPFELGISDNLRKIGWANLIGGFTSELLGLISRILLTKAYAMDELFTSPSITKTEFVFTMNFDFVIITCILFFLSYIFTYGQNLQQESDETL